MRSSENIRIEKIKKGDLEELAGLLTDAFETNPAYSLVFAGSSRMREGLLWMFNTSLFLINRRQTVTNVIKESGTGKIIGAFSIIPPGGVKNGALDYLHIRLPWFITTFGFATLRKMLQMDQLNKEVLAESMPSDGYYYLSMVAIREEYRGKGIGSYAIKNSLDELSASAASGQMIGLTTQLPENVVFYSRLGFETTGEGTVDIKGDSYYNWNMKYYL